MIKVDLLCCCIALLTAFPQNLFAIFSEFSEDFQGKKLKTRPKPKLFGGFSHMHGGNEVIYKRRNWKKKEICVTLFGRLGKPAEERRTFPRRRRRPKWRTRSGWGRSSVQLTSPEINIEREASFFISCSSIRHVQAVQPCFPPQLNYKQSIFRENEVK